MIYDNFDDWAESPYYDTWLIGFADELMAGHEALPFFEKNAPLENVQWLSNQQFHSLTTIQKAAVDAWHDYCDAHVAYRLTDDKDQKQIAESMWSTLYDSLHALAVEMAEAVAERIYDHNQKHAHSGQECY